jgi:isopentenyl diphosphate isomerase/L-lactate dehydrogenase-like FMN-dependent dehydrogenase
VLDGVAPALPLLPAIRAALGPDFPLLFDGGIRRGSDALAALALGAQAVLVGAPQLHALAVGGMAGVAHMLHILRTEFELAMAQCGCARIADIDRELVVAL